MYLWVWALFILFDLVQLKLSLSLQVMWTINQMESQTNSDQIHLSDSFKRVMNWCNLAWVVLILKADRNTHTHGSWNRRKRQVSYWYMWSWTTKHSVTTVTSVPWRGNECCFGNALRDKSWSTCEINPKCNWDVRAGDVTNQEAIKPTQMKLSLA